MLFDIFQWTLLLILYMAMFVLYVQTHRKYIEHFASCKSEIHFNNVKLELLKRGQSQILHRLKRQSLGSHSEPVLYISKDTRNMQ